MKREKVYIAIDLKSFYASVECVARGLDPLRTNLVVADPSRTEKTICLAVTPSLKAYGIPGRARLFEVVQKVREINREREWNSPCRRLYGVSSDADELAADPNLALGYITAPPQMAHYMAVSSQIYSIYLRYIAREDIHVYSIDEVFIDATAYLDTYKISARELTVRLIHSVLEETGITATAGIGTNLYLAKIAMDIEAKHSPTDKDGVRIASLDEMTYRRKYWSHRPLTDFWRVGRGLADRLAENGMYTMGDIARCSEGKPGQRYNEDLLYSLFGVNAELLIDHAWGWEPCTLADIKSYRPATNSISSGQVLQCPYDYDRALTVVREMTDQLTLDLVRKGLVTDKLTLTINYDTENLSDATRRTIYKGQVTTDYYGRPVPKHAHGTANLGRHTSSSKLITDAVVALYGRIVDRNLTVRYINVTAARVIAEDRSAGEQLDLFEERYDTERERRGQEAILAIRGKFGKNAILKGTNFEDGATAIQRNGQIGGHKA